MTRMHQAFAALAICTLLAGPAGADDSKTLAEAATSGDLVVTGKLAAVKIGTITESDPPTTIYQLTFDAKAEVLKGQLPDGAELAFSDQGGKLPQPAKGAELIAISRGGKISHLAKATDENLAAVRKALPAENSGPVGKPMPGGRILIGGGVVVRPMPAPIDGGPIRRMPPEKAPDNGQPVQEQKQPTDRDRLIEAVTGGEVVFVAKLAKAVAGIQTMSMPPTTSYTLNFEGVAALRGDKPADDAVFGYNHTQGRPGAPAVGTKYIVVATAPPPQPKKDKDDANPDANRLRNRLQLAGAGGARVTALIAATDENVKLVKTLVTLPVGWTVDAEGNAISPWAALRDKAWPKGLKVAGQGEASCSKTGRPVLGVPEGVAFSVEQVIPEKVEKFQNPYGDGEFKLTVANTTDKDLAVPALLADGDAVLWADSLVIIERGKTHLLPSAGKVGKDAKPVTLKAGQSLTTTVDTLVLRDVTWPRGGSRVHFKFGLGDRVADNFFYYFSNRHDAMRAKAQADAGVKPAAEAGQGEVAAGWTPLFANEGWYKGQRGKEQQYVGKLEAIPQAGGMSTLQRTSYYKLGGRKIYTGAKKVDALDKLVGQRVVIRGKPYDINLEGQSVSEIWPAAVRQATDADKDTANTLPAGQAERLRPLPRPDTRRMLEEGPAPQPLPAPAE